MVWKRLGALVVFPLQMIYLVAKAAVGLVLPAKLRDLSRENVLITGGGRGIGRQLAREFAERGARKIVLWGRTEKCLKETTEEIRQMGTECHYFICDVGNREEVYQTAKAVREKVGDITILVNNAAVVHGKSLMDSDDDALLKSQHINTLGQFWTTKAFLPRMLELQNGHIVCLNSVLALSAIPGAIDYCTSKASAFAFMESLTLGLLDCPGVSATTVLPFHTSTEMFQGMRVSHNSYFINAAAFDPQQPRESALVPISQTWELRLRGAKLLAQGHTEGNRLNMLLPQVWAASVGVPQPLPAAEARDGGPEDGGSRAAQSGPAPPPVDHACPHYLEKHTPTGRTGGDLQILRNLHLHEHFQRADIKAGRRDTLASHGT
ncbi:short-chain dehydrogenase/reductase 3 isoform X2 [Mirounga angustirostris]|uniref:short-chain dehydrogenase/reductase 3 isoform X1 n=3 Tax=Mirounga leonina TaxID=9715 RepID=UPI00156C35E2|nr:short-chain dehydrogenase/reductase 3 isoform X1 [Mirounga leonina]XP_045754619.1 short-chain dehydrogenase/reductase 3 isoform X1 [Mirounga angustirostris]